MRFLEKHSTAILDGKHSPLARAVVPFDITEPARWYFEEADVYEQSVRSQFPSVVAPYPVTFLEYKIPPKWKVKDGEDWKLAQSPHGPSDYFGVLIVQEELPRNYTGKNPSEGAILSDLLTKISGSSPPRWKQYTFFFAGNQQDHQVCFWAENYVEASGRMLAGPVHDIHASLVRKAKAKSPNEIYGDMIRTYGYPVYFALSLLKSPKVETFSETLSARERRAIERAHGMAFNYGTVRCQELRKAAPTIPDALEEAQKVWTLTDKEAYVSFKPGHEQAIEDLKTYKFKIKR